MVRDSPERIVSLCPSLDELASVTGIERDRCRLVDGELLSWHGSKTLEGLSYAAGLLRDARHLEVNS